MPNKIRPDIRSHIGCDFIAANGDRVTAFQLVGTERNRPVSIACIDFTNGKITREMQIPALNKRMGGVRRLARRALKKSKPQRFAKTP